MKTSIRGFECGSSSLFMVLIIVIGILSTITGNSSCISGEHTPLAGGSYAYTRREPIGVCGGIGKFSKLHKKTSED